MAPNGQIHILLIDDDEDEYILTMDLLSRLNTGPASDDSRQYTIDWAASYEQGLQAFEQKPYDIFLIDYRLGERDGIELIKELKSRGCQAPLILLTGQGNYQLDLLAMNLGASDYLVKGQVDYQMLERSIRYALERRRVEEDLEDAYSEMELRAMESERLLAELEREQARIQAIIENAPEAIVVVDEQSRIVMTNPLAETLYVRPIPFGEDYHSHADLMICYPDGTPYDPRHLPLTRSALDGETYSNLELMIILPDGQRRFLLVNSAPIRDRQARISGAVGIFQDITARKKAEEETFQNATRAGLFARLSDAFNEAGLNYPEVTETVAREIAETFGDACIIRILSADGEWIDPAAYHHPHGEALSAMRALLSSSRQHSDEGLAGRVIQTGHSLHIPFVPRSEASLQNQAEYWPKAKGFPICSLLIVPLHVQERLIGTLAVSRFRRFEPYNAEDLIFFQDLANRVSLHIENARLFQAETQRIRELDALHTATAALLTTLDLDTLLGHTLDAAMSAIQAAENGVLHLLNPETGELKVRSAAGYSEKRKSALTSAQAAMVLLPVVDGRKPLMISGADTGDEDFAREFSCMISAPLVQSNEVLGTITLTSSHPGSFSEADLRLLISFAETTSAAIQNATLHSEVQKQAVTDSLTGLYNRRGFIELSQSEFQRSLRYRHPLSVILLDIDHFKRVNDSHGHLVGDQVLTKLGQRLQDRLRDKDILSRYGGEEFAISLPETDIGTAFSIAERLRQNIESSPIPTQSGPISITISLGISNTGPNITDLDDLVERADRALYRAKQSGRNRIEVD